jgi:hypothetical protein
MDAKVLVHSGARHRITCLQSASTSATYVSRILGPTESSQQGIPSVARFTDVEAVEGEGGSDDAYSILEYEVCSIFFSRILGLTELSQQ